jgi:hypothetical protein
MGKNLFLRRQSAALATDWLVAAVVVVVGGTAAASDHLAGGASSPRLPRSLDAVAASSVGNAWAVGATSTGQSLIVRWSGRGWQRVGSPRGSNRLTGVAVTSARNAWAVGSTSAAGPLILHWNGTAWTRVPRVEASAARALAGSSLYGVSVISSRDAWAVGSIGYYTVMGPWNGRVWTRFPSAAPGVLYAVTATSSRNAWAVGHSCTGCGTLSEADHTVILHWNGTRWT